ncbi:MAG TPA: cyclase family protein [Gaiellaceae bacterium]
MPQIIDLSAPIAPSAPAAAPFLRTEIEYRSHADGAAEIEALFGVPARLLRDGEGWTRETLTELGTHNSTHVDAPYHYNSTIGGRPAETIDQLPLDWFFAPGVVADFTGRADGDAIGDGEMEQAIAVAGHELRERDIVLVRTGCDRFYTDDDYMLRGPGVTAEATRWLFDHGVRVMGIDAWGWDRPLNLQAAEALTRDEPGVFWAAHQCDLPYSQIERLSNLSALPSTGFTVACFPLKIVGASGAPARVVAIVADPAR